MELLVDLLISAFPIETLTPSLKLIKPSLKSGCFNIGTGII